jgi:SAM-dependent methyltransferase
MSITPERLKEIVSELGTRPQHEKVRALVYELLVDGLEAKSTELDFEHRVPEVHGRIDALLGRTLFEFKTDLRREQRDAENKLPDYLAQREKETNSHFIGVATDGATFTPYELRDNKLYKFESFITPQPEKANELLLWLSSVVAVNSDLQPNSEVVKRELGRASLAWNIARQELVSIWSQVNQHPDVLLKRDLWGQLLRRVYGDTISDDNLFFQHTYLTVIAKTMAAKVLGVVVSEPEELLSGRRFTEAGIGGVVESDFFDWLLVTSKGVDLTRRIALQAERFRLEDVQTDVLKGLYESLIDPEQRHLLGEYYTPDWLAYKICNDAIDNPLEQRVLDPACGSGTFVFHAVRRLLMASQEAGISTHNAIEHACQQICGIDVHPVAVQIARVTFLLAIGPTRLKQRPSVLNVPIYIGDSLQWNTRGFLAERDVLIEVPKTNETLEFPFEVTHDPNIFDAVINRMLDFSQQDANAEGLIASLGRDQHLTEDALKTLGLTYDTLHRLNRDGRDHIWGFVARNLVRPIWLSQTSQKVDVLIGNPPWLSYRFMDSELQKRFREECQAFGIWEGGKVATHQDMSSYFYLRSIELYLKVTGKIAFVMPYAAMTRHQFEGFRKGLYGASRTTNSRLLYMTVQFTDAWILADNVQPLFPVPACVLFGNPSDNRPVLPASVSVASGILPRRDASFKEAMSALKWDKSSWPAQYDDTIHSPYQDKFKNGATIVPRMLCVVDMAEEGSLGQNPGAPVVQSRRTNQEKEPWKSLPSLRGNLEKDFIRPLYLGESIAPYRVLNSVLAVIPWDEMNNTLLDAENAQKTGYVHLSRWLGNAERLWADQGRDALTFIQQIDYFGKLSSQFPIAPLRVVYSASGTLPAAAVVSDSRGIIEHQLYCLKIENEQEGLYLLAILNSETARARAENLQSRGQWGARHFDKVILSLPIPIFDASNKLHKTLAKAAIHAEKVANGVRLKEGINFITARQAIRAALREDGISLTIDGMVSELLSSKTENH